MITYRQLGNTDLKIAPLIFGGNVFGWTIDEKKSFALLDAFSAAGFNGVDTADSYSRWAPGNKGGESETIIGKWMRQNGNREKIIISTKVGSDMGQGHKDVSKNYILKAVEDSLTRLQTDYIDLYQTHWDNENTPVEETLEAYDQLVKQGKVRWIGASNLSPERLTASLSASKEHHYPAYQTLQPEYNLYDREKFEKHYQPICIAHNLSVINYYSLASGFLSGKYRSEADLGKSSRGGGIKKYLNERGFKILAALDSISALHQTVPASVAIAWLLQQPTIAAPIASATGMEQLHALIAAATLQLSEADRKVLNEASAW
ncbi:aldo/keto reductase [Agriterribacter sp.]|uniref:aldo/keto reductase n=1 Tax=Agriterribacter sp. TaxID=2821509 RepID=UPI002CBE7CD7|nr:aldo/keto reductase [Agriterribacter sp.]HTN06374.1 aldo/keto reductase [Agriterribacter sp.]